MAELDEQVDGSVLDLDVRIPEHPRDLLDIVPGGHRRECFERRSPDALVLVVELRLQCPSDIGPVEFGDDMGQVHTDRVIATFEA